MVENDGVEIKHPVFLIHDRPGGENVHVFHFSTADEHRAPAVMKFHQARIPACCTFAD
jgi:hypothetical protein